MGSEQILKKSLLGGFKKEGVLNYIEQLQSEILTLKKEVNENSDCKNKLENIISEKDSSDSEIASLEKENELLKAEISELKDKNESLLNENESLNAKISESEKKIAELEEKQKKWEEKVSIIEAKFAEIESSYSKMGETDSKVNGILSEAQSHSDKIISDAKKSAYEISTKASFAVNNAKKEIKDASDRIQTACVNFDSSVTSLKSSAENLLKILSELSDEEE